MGKYWRQDLKTWRHKKFRFQQIPIIIKWEWKLQFLQIFSWMFILHCLHAKIKQTYIFVHIYMFLAKQIQIEWFVTLISKNLFADLEYSTTVTFPLHWLLSPTFSILFFSFWSRQSRHYLISRFGLRLLFCCTYFMSLTQYGDVISEGASLFSCTSIFTKKKYL